MAEKGLIPPLLIFPEGATSNGDHLIEFKKGAFAGENSVQPFSIKYYSKNMHPGHDVMEMHSHFFLLSTTPYVTIHLKELPVFKPNEYYWKNHSQEGKQRW